MYDAQAETVAMPALGEEGELCSTCAAPLATDQRYCLNCGEPRGDRRDELLGLATADGAGEQGPPPAATVPATAPSPAPRPRETSPLAAVGGIAILGLMLLAGVLIGRGGDDEQQTAAPQVVTVSESATAADETATAEPADDQTASQETGGGGGGADKPAEDSGGGGGNGGGGGDLTAGGGEDLEAPVQASTEDLQALEAQSGDDYAEASEDLPDTIATPGEAPPVDNEAPGGGTEATTIK